MIRVKKAIIPAAGLGSRFLPATIACPKEMLTIVDKPVIQYIVEEAVNAGIKEILIITRPDKEMIERHFFPSKEIILKLKEKKKIRELKLLKNLSSLAKISFIFQAEQKGLADAIYRGKKFVKNEPFAVLLGDTIINGPGILQLVNQYQKTGLNNVLVEYLDDKNDVVKYGIVEPTNKINIHNRARYFEVKDLVEKPTVALAPSRYAIACRYIFNPDIFALIEKTKPGKSGELQITDTMRFLAKENGLNAVPMRGEKYDIGGKLDFIKANINFALEDKQIAKEIKKYVRKSLI